MPLRLRALATASPAILILTFRRSLLPRKKPRALQNLAIRH